MLNKIYDKIKKIIKENYKDALIMAVIIIVMLFPLPYYIYIGGGTININDRVIIDNSYKSRGTFNLAYVSELRATPPTYLLSFLLPNWELEPISSYKAAQKETTSDVSKRDRLYLEESNLNALKVAYTSSGKYLNIKNNRFTIIYVDDKVSEDVKIGDVLISADGKDIEKLDQYKSIVESKNYGDTVKLNILRDNNQKEVNIKVRKIDNKKLTGLSLVNVYEYEAKPQIKFNFEKSESGPSGGLMLALSIYDKLVSEDITKGLKIVGTGTIDENGNVGEIGGVKYKLIGAVNANADVFLAPSGDNYSECIEIKKKKNYNIKILEIKTFRDALEKLKNI